MADIVNDLRRISGGSAVVEVAQKAADEIERLRAEIASLVAAYDDARSLGGDSEILRSKFRRLAAVTPKGDDRG